MKIKSLLIGMLACSAMVACTDDVLENGLEGQEAKKMDAYISLTINSNTNSSRSTGDGYGDNDGDAEHSGHEVDALTAENAVNNILVIVTPTGPVVKDNTIDGFVKLIETGEFTQTGTDITDIAPERVDYIQEYKALVVINPVEGLLTELGYKKEDGTFTKHHDVAYTAVCNYSGVGYTGTATTASNFMMANQTEVTVTPDESNQTAADAAVAEIEVERVASKITFRPTVGSNDNVGTDDNKYDIKVSIKNYKAKAERKWYLEAYTIEKEGEDGTKTSETVEKYTYAYFNQAKQDEAEVWVLLKEDKQFDGGQVDPNDVVGFFKDSGTDYTGYVEIEANTATGELAYKGNREADLFEEITVDDKQTYLNTLTFVVEDITPTPQPEETYSVKLEKYALTNMTTSVYAVRHKSNGTTTTTLSKLTTGDYIVVPYAADVTNWNSITTSVFEYGTDYETIKKQADDYTIDNWQSLPTSVGYKNDGTAEDNDDILKQETTHDELAVGFRL